MQACSTYVYFKKVFEMGFHTTDYLMWNITNVINFTKVLFTAWKCKKALMAILKENLRLKQLRLNYINSQKKQTEIIFLD